MEGDIGRSHIKTDVRQVHLVAFLCLGVANKYTLKSVKGKFEEGGRVILNKGSTSKDPRRKG